MKFLSNPFRISCIALLIIGGNEEDRIMVVPSFERIGVVSSELSIMYAELAAAKAEGKAKGWEGYDFYICL